MAAPLPLEGRVAIVTGASRRQGIGAAIVRRLVSDGAAVLVHGWSLHDPAQPWGADPAGAEGLCEELVSSGGRCQHLECDLADPEAPEALVDAAHAVFGRLDILVANHAHSSAQRLDELTAEEIDRAFAVNARATMLLVKAMAARHDRRDGGRVVLFTSGQHHGAMANELPYVASKGALHQLTASLAVALAPKAITRNCIDPGPSDTGYADAALHAKVVAAHPSGRWGTPEDAARLVAFLVSDEAAWIAGQVIGSDGGWSAR